MSIRKLMTKVNLESKAEETVGATEEDILDVIESDEITSELVEASKEANDAAEADQELTDLAEEVTETIGDIEEKLEDTADVEPEDVAVAQESLKHYKKMLGIKDEGTKISLESMRNDTKANLENIKVELEGVLDTIKDSAKKVWDWIVSIFKKIKELIVAGFNKLVSFFKNLAWKNKSEQLKVVDDIVKAMEDVTKSDSTYVNVVLYKEAVDDFNDMDDEFKAMEDEFKAAAMPDLSDAVNTYKKYKKANKEVTDRAVNTYNMVSKRIKELANQVEASGGKKPMLALPKPKEVTKKEEVKTIVELIEPKEAEKRIADLLENKYCLLGLMQPVQTQRMYDYILSSLLKYGSETIKDLEAALNGNGKEVDISVMAAALYTKITSGLGSGSGITDYLTNMPARAGYKLDSVYGRSIDTKDVILNLPRVGNTITLVLRNGEIVKSDVNVLTINKNIDISKIGFNYPASALEDALKEVTNFDKKYKSDLDKFYSSLENIKKLMDSGKIANVKAGKPAASEDNDDYVSQFKFNSNDVTKFCKDMVALTMMLIESYYELSLYLVYALGTVNKVTVNK